LPSSSVVQLVNFQFVDDSFVLWVWHWAIINVIFSFSPLTIQVFHRKMPNFYWLMFSTFSSIWLSFQAILLCQYSILVYQEITYEDLEIIWLFAIIDWLHSLFNRYLFEDLTF
jgi:hypothetical protein